MSNSDNLSDLSATLGAKEEVLQIWVEEQEKRRAFEYELQTARMQTTRSIATMSGSVVVIAVGVFLTRVLPDPAAMFVIGIGLSGLGMAGAAATGRGSNSPKKLVFGCVIALVATILFLSKQIAEFLGSRDEGSREFAWVHDPSWLLWVSAGIAFGFFLHLGTAALLRLVGNRSD